MDRLTLTDLLEGVTVALLYGFLAVLIMVSAGPDYTDSGVGCVDDCLEIQDEADTLTSKERN